MASKRTGWGSRRRAGVALIGAAAGALLVGCAGDAPSNGTNAETITPSAASSTAATSATPTGAAPPTGASDADDHGFTVFGNGARCRGGDDAEMFMRTERSALVVCRRESGGLYYRGYRISDGASIDLDDVSRQSGGYVAVNAPDNARYLIAANGFQLVQNGTVVVDELAVESGPAGWAGAPSTPAPQAASPVVLGSASEMGPSSRGYGAEQPQVISMGSCANAISRIEWQDWGSPVAHGSGLGCVQVGQPPRYDLVASDMGRCDGAVAYRKLQIGGDQALDICSG